MDFALTDEQELLLESVREFCDRYFTDDVVKEMYENGGMPDEIAAAYRDAGFGLMGIPEEYGGIPADKVTLGLMIEELYHSAGCMHILYQNSLSMFDIMEFGTEEQKQKYLPRLTKGGELGAFALTEPGAGSDAARAQTTAILDTETNEYVLNGTKCFISGGSRAGVLVVFALTNPAAGLKGMSAIIVEAGTPGFTVGKVENKMGLRGSETAELIFEDCRVPAENLLGQEGKGFKIAMQALDGARIGVGAQSIGLAEGALELTVKYMHERVQFGKPIATLQGLQWYVADMATKTEAAKWLTYYAAYLDDSGKPFGKEAAMCKLNASENARFVTNLALQIHGGYGYMHDYPLERMYRDAKITEIYEGTSEIHKVVISRAVLGK